MGYNLLEVIFYRKSSGRRPVKEFLETCSTRVNEAFRDAVVLLESGTQLQMPLSRNLASIYPGLHELRLKDRNGQFRVFYFIKKGAAIYMLHAFNKKTQELPKNEIEVALKRIKEL